MWLLLLCAIAVSGGQRVGVEAADTDYSYHPFYNNSQAGEGVKTLVIGAVICVCSAVSFAYAIVCMILYRYLDNDVDGTSLGDSNAYDVIKYTYEDEYEVAVMNADEKATLTHLKGTTDTPPTGAVIIDMGDCKEQRAFLYADVTSIASNHIAGSRQSESQPTSRRPSFSYQITKPSVQILRMNSQSDLAQRLAQLIRVENRHESL
eukprot:Em0006g288a